MPPIYSPLTPPISLPVDHPHNPPPFFKQSTKFSQCSQCVWDMEPSTVAWEPVSEHIL